MMLVNITIPVYNEEGALRASIERLRSSLKGDYEILICDNGSTDRTKEIALALEKEYPGVFLLSLKKKGRGRALKAAWQRSKAGILSYMDVDLSTDLAHFPQMIEAIRKGADIAYGSRLSKRSRTKRSFLRELLSRGYNLMVRLALRTRISDLQCGFKAIRKKAFMELLPYLEDNEWFFDTELLIIAERKGKMLKAIPVKWTEDAGSTVRIFDTVVKYLKNTFRLRRRLKSL